LAGRRFRGNIRRGVLEIEPDGAGVRHTPFGGEFVRDRDGSPVAPGTLLEAYIGDALCGVASIRPGGDYTLLVAGPQVEGCAVGGEIRFFVGGEQASQTATNDLQREGSEREPFDLTVR
jgi:hypothetical protein